MLGDITSTPITETVPACALLASGFKEHIQFVVSSAGRVVSFEYSVLEKADNTACANVNIASGAHLPILNTTIELLDAEDWCQARTASPQVHITLY